MHSPIKIKNISLSYPNKNCFEDFSNTIYPGSRIALIGRNGSGKSSLLNILRGQLMPTSGACVLPDDLIIGYVEQTIADFRDLSGGQRLNKHLSKALAKSPNLLLLDEPTNHLDQDNRKSLMQMLKSYQGTLIIASHDTELLRCSIETLWHIESNQVNEFNGTYDAYMRYISQKRAAIEKELALLRRDKKASHNALMKEQVRAKKRKAYGEKKYAGDKLALRGKQAQGEATRNKHNKMINNKKNHLLAQLAGLYLPEVIIPKFSMPAGFVHDHQLLSINDANIGYKSNYNILIDISLSISGRQRVAIVGKNAAGKSLLLKAIACKEAICKTGSWCLPKLEQIGYLDQHYANLIPDLPVIAHIKRIRPDWTEIEARRHLNDFLFRSDQEVLQLTCSLSGGEKARLSLSIIAAKTPRLLL